MGRRDPGASASRTDATLAIRKVDPVRKRAPTDDRKHDPSASPRRRRGTSTTVRGDRAGDGGPDVTTTRVAGRAFVRATGVVTRRGDRAPARPPTPGSAVISSRRAAPSPPCDTPQLGALADLSTRDELVPHRVVQALRCDRFGKPSGATGRMDPEHRLETTSRPPSSCDAAGEVTVLEPDVKVLAKCSDPVEQLDRHEDPIERDKVTVLGRLRAAVVEGGSLSRPTRSYSLRASNGIANLVIGARPEGPAIGEAIGIDERVVLQDPHQFAASPPSSLDRHVVSCADSPVRRGAKEHLVRRELLAHSVKVIEERRRAAVVHDDQPVHGVVCARTARIVRSADHGLSWTRSVAITAAAGLIFFAKCVRAGGAVRPRRRRLIPAAVHVRATRARRRRGHVGRLVGDGRED